ncbi:MAG: hypothetical protein PHG64_14140 [Paludibacter sp.]|nr:hypothetical protein [Paludibacter sp.]
MKKLTKMSLEKLAKTMNLISENEMDMYWGMYQGDCFWRCVAWLSIQDRTEEAAAEYALQYTADTYFGGCTVSADYYLTTYSAGLNFQDARSYVQGNSTLDNRILYFQTESFSEFGENVTGWRAVVQIFENDPNVPFGSTKYYDPQNNEYIIISDDKLESGVNVVRVT